MVIRIDKGVARYGVPGLILGIGLAWGSGMRGPEVAAQTAPGGPRATSSGPAEGNRSGGQRPVAGGEVNGTLALITTSGPAQWLYLVDTKDRAYLLFIVSIPRIPRGLSSSRPLASTNGISSWNITTTRLRSPTRSRRRWRLWVGQ